MGVYKHIVTSTRVTSDAAVKIHTRHISWNDQRSSSSKNSEPCQRLRRLLRRMIYPYLFFGGKKTKLVLKFLHKHNAWYRWLQWGAGCVSLQLQSNSFSEDHITLHPLHCSPLQLNSFSAHCILCISVSCTYNTSSTIALCFSISCLCGMLWLLCQPGAMPSSSHLSGKGLHLAAIY